MGDGERGCWKEGGRNEGMRTRQIETSRVRVIREGERERGRERARERERERERIRV